MAKTYTADEFKTMLIGQMNAIKGLESEFDPVDIDQAFAEAEHECGFDFPAQTDTQAGKKYRWLANRIRRWFYHRLWEQYILRFKVGDLEAQQLSMNLEKIIQYLDGDFVKAAELDPTLFADADVMFGDVPVVQTPGLVEDRIGQSVEERE